MSAANSGGAGDLGTTEPSVADSSSRLERAGFVGQWIVRPSARIECGRCRTEFDPGRVRYVDEERVDVQTDPAQQALVAALECRKCGNKGTYAFTYGAGGDANEGEVLRLLLEQREARRDNH